MIGIYGFVLSQEIVYVGSTIDIRRRYRDHMNLLRKNKHHSIKLQNAFNKYGESKFSFVVLEETTRERLLVREQYYMDAYEPRYNVLKFAGNAMGYIPNAQTRQKMSAAHKGKVFSDETRLRMAEAKKGKAVAAKTYRLQAPNGHIVEIYNMDAFCRQHGFTAGNLNKVISGKRKSAYGYTLPREANI